MGLEDNILQQLLREVSQLTAKVDMLIDVQTERLIQQGKKFEDHEKRIRFIERYIFILIGAGSIAGFILSWIK